MTRFQQMPAGQRNSWVDWANSHDWGGERSARYDASTGEMVTYGAEHDGAEWSVIESRHTSPAEMRAWAGY